MKSMQCTPLLASLLLLTLSFESAQAQETAALKKQPVAAAEPEASSLAGAERAGNLTGTPVSILVQGPEEAGARTMKFLRSGELAIAEGDIVLGTYSELTSGISKNSSFVVNTSLRWPKVNGQVVVPYVMDASLSSSARSVIQAAIADYNKYTCVRFVPRTSEQYYLKLFKGDGCYSYVGYARQPGQVVSIGAGCEYKGTALHELNHALGMFHEQSRPDRDHYVNIMFGNVETGKESQFEKAEGITTQALSYDYSSIMHYGQYAFSRNGKMTIVTRDPSAQNVIGNRVGLSRQDVLSINKAYCQ